MTEGINHVILQGQLCWPELKYTTNGSALFKAKICIPTVDQRTNDDRKSYLRITAWDEFAEYLNSLTARTKVKISGRIQQRSFTNKEGRKQNVTDIVVDGVETTESNEGLNQFVLQGEIVWPELRQVGEYKTSLFKSKIKIPFFRDDDPETLRHTYVRITVWDTLAEEISKIDESQFVKVSGHIQDRTWTSDEGQKRVFTDAIVTNFVVSSQETI